MCTSDQNQLICSCLWPCLNKNTKNPCSYPHQNVNIQFDKALLMTEFAPSRHHSQVPSPSPPRAKAAKNYQQTIACLWLSPTMPNNKFTRTSSSNLNVNIHSNKAYIIRKLRSLTTSYPAPPPPHSPVPYSLPLRP